MNKKVLNSYLNYILFFFLLTSFSLYAQSEDRNGYILFPGCKSLEAKEEVETCNTYELRKFLAHHVKYPSNALKKGYEGKITVKYVLTEDGNLLISPPDNTQAHSSLGKAAIQVMNELKDSINSGMFKIIPARLGGKSVVSYYKVPIIFSLSEFHKEEEQEQPDNQRKIIIATYRTSEKTVQFRRDLEGNIYAYSLNPEGEKLLIKINGNTDPEQLTEEEKSYFFLYNLTFLKSEILLTMGKVDGKEYELFIDKSIGEQEDDDLTPDKSGMNINVYSRGGAHEPIETFKSVDQLFNSRYAPLLFK